VYYVLYVVVLYSLYMFGSLYSQDHTFVVALLRSCYCLAYRVYPWCDWEATLPPQRVDICAESGCCTTRAVPGIGAKLSGSTSGESNRSSSEAAYRCHPNWISGLLFVGVGRPYVLAWDSPIGQRLVQTNSPLRPGERRASE